MLRQIGTQFELFMVSKIQVSQWLTKKKTNFFQWNQSMDKHIKHHIKLEFQENHRTLCYEYKNVILWKRLVNAPPTSLIDSTTSLKVKTTKDKELGHAPWLVALWGWKGTLELRDGD
jgi:hypothetical protein